MLNYKNFENQSNPYNTNLFETCTGALNLAPTKFSGNYKIVWSIDTKSLYLDDYNGRRVLLNMDISFLDQVSTFLKSKSEIVKTEYLQYGCFQKSTKKSFHVPIYLNKIDLNDSLNQYPKYCIISKVVNEHITNVDYLYNYGKIIEILDLEKIGLYKIFDQIVFEPLYDYPFYLNFEDNFIQIFGYSIQNKSAISQKLDIKNSMANQTYFEVFNNMLMNYYVKNDLIFPRFLNLEFEFSYSDKYVTFNNFYGYLTNNKTVQLNQMVPEKFYVKLKDFTTDFNPNGKSIEWSQIKTTDYPETKAPESYINIVKSGSVKKLTTQKPQFRFKSNRLSIDDTITILDAGGNLEFEYVVKEEDIKDTLYESWLSICSNATYDSDHYYVFNITKISEDICIITIIAQTIDLLLGDFTIQIPKYFQTIDRYENSSNINKFRGITNFDLYLSGQSNLVDGYSTIIIEGINYNIVERFKFNDKAIIRLNKNTNLIQISSECLIFDTLLSEIKELVPIPFLKYECDLKSIYPLYDKDIYCAELLTKFNKPQYVSLFQEMKTTSIKQYVKEDSINNDLEDSDIIVNNDITSNQTKVMNMMFNSPGESSYITPNILNIDKQFYVQNGNLDVNQLDSDLLRYNWFLIKGECPLYLQNDSRSLRYFTDVPKLTSRLIKITDNYCETIFLGIKYQLPNQYTNYQFCVYLNFNNRNDSNLNYRFQINTSKKTIFLVINKYLDFVDLLRGGNYENIPLLDLSFFYSVNQSFNENSEAIEEFNSIILKLCSEFKLTDEPIYFKNSMVKDWKFQDTDGKWYIALQREFSDSSDKINNMKILFPESGDFKFYVYTSIQYTAIPGEPATTYTYTSAECLVKNIVELNDAYLWCEDITIKFFDTPQIFLQKYNSVTHKEDILLVDKANIISMVPKNLTSIFGDYVKISTIIVDGNNTNFELLLPDKTLSVKEYYFEINQIITENELGVKNISRSVFRFNESMVPGAIYYNISDNQMIDLFYDPDRQSSAIDETVYLQKINLFNRNQIWRVTQDLFKTSIKFKYLSKIVVRNIINKLMVTNLIDYSNYKNIISDKFDANGNQIVENTDLKEFVKLNILDLDKNVVIWNILGKEKIVLINRFKSPYLPFMQLYSNEIEFQLNKFKVNSSYSDTTPSLFNIYDKNFYGENISATGFWSEVQGNIISSLFSNEQDIIITIPYSNESINYKNLLINSLDINNLIIGSDNTDYIKNFNQNVSKYILNQYSEYLLKTFYNLDSILNDNNEKINFITDSKTPYSIIIKDQNLTVNLSFIFKRK